METIFRDIPRGFNPLISLERSAITAVVTLRHRWVRRIKRITYPWVLFGALLLPNCMGFAPIRRS